MQFQIEVRPWSIADRTFVAFYQIEAVTEQAALEEARRKFREQNPDKDVSAREFRVVRS